MKITEKGHPQFNTGRTWFKNGNKLFLGRRHSKKTRTKISLSKIGKPLSLEHRKKLSASHQKIAINNWREFSRKTYRRIRGTLKYSEWRKQVFERDNFTCQICGVRGNKLHVDHFPKPMCLYIKENSEMFPEKDLYDVLMMDGILWNKKSGRTLCVGCHRKTDSYLNRNFKGLFTTSTLTLL